MFGLDSRYLGGLRLLQATCKKFYQYCAAHGFVKRTCLFAICYNVGIIIAAFRIALAKRNFTLSYETNIPRQVVCWTEIHYCTLLRRKSCLSLGISWQQVGVCCMGCGHCLSYLCCISLLFDNWSAIVVGTLNCLMRFFNVTDKVWNISVNCVIVSACAFI